MTFLYNKKQQQQKLNKQINPILDLNNAKSSKKYHCACSSGRFVLRMPSIRKPAEGYHLFIYLVKHLNKTTVNNNNPVVNIFIIKITVFIEQKAITSRYGIFLVYGL